MFEDGEAAIFKRLGMQTVLFGRTIAGRNMPSLTYMLGYDDMAHREKLWGDFGRDPEWQKLRATPGLSDAEIVSNITQHDPAPAAVLDDSIEDGLQLVHRPGPSRPVVRIQPSFDFEYPGELLLPPSIGGGNVLARIRLQARDARERGTRSRPNAPAPRRDR